MMDLQRSLFIIALLIVSFLVWKSWEKDKNSRLQSQIKHMTVTAPNHFNDENLQVSKYKKVITIETDVLNLVVNARGGDIEQASLLGYAKELKSKEPFQLLETTPEFIYQAQSGLTGRDGPDNPVNGPRPLYKVSLDKDKFTLSTNQDRLVVPMEYKDDVGDVFTKTFILKRGEYAVNIDYSVKNVSEKPIELSIFGQLKQSIDLPLHRKNKGGFSMHTFRGAAYSTLNGKYKKYRFDTIAKDENLNVNSTGGWIAMLQQYFATAWVPNSGGINNFYTAFYNSNLGNGTAAIGYRSQPVLVQPGCIHLFQSTLWIGPEIQEKMAAIAPHLDLTVDYGWLWFISQPLFRLLKFIHRFLGNWGFSIIVITFIVRGVMYPLTKAQYTSIAKMRILQPKVREIRERLGNDRQRISQEMMALYKEEKVNPLGGCLPLLIQMPIFLALYYMLIGSVELRHAPFSSLWIHDLSAQDPYYILPILMGVTMYLMQKVSPTDVTDLTQKKIMVFMPFIFTLFFLWLPSGLVLYYVVNNLVTIFQQQLIYRELEKRGLYSREKVSEKQIK